MTKGTDTVVELPLLGRLTFNEWHALVMGALLSITAIAVVIGAPPTAIGLMLLADKVAIAARFSKRVPVLNEAWYFLATVKIPILAAVIVA
jgi:hypothetical protein